MDALNRKETRKEVGEREDRARIQGGEREEREGREGGGRREKGRREKGEQVMMQALLHMQS